MSRNRSGISEGGPLGFSDAAKRASDIVNLHLVADMEGNRGRFVAIRLSDGGSDGVIYDLLSDAVRNQLTLTQCMYVAITFSGLPPQEADLMLAYHRRLIEAETIQFDRCPQRCWQQGAIL